jgi:hypothetical protein
MDDFVTIASFSQPYQVHIIQGRLMTEGIECRLMDEYMAYTQLYSNAVSGIKLQVKKEDYEKAKNIMIENGYKFNPDERTLGWYLFLLESTARIPGLRAFKLEQRLMILAALMVLLLAIYFF